MVTITVMALLMLAAAPSIGNWIANARVRSAAESIQNGLRLAQAEAMRRSRLATFRLTNATPAKDAALANPATNWSVQAEHLLGVEPAASGAFVRGSVASTTASVSIDGPKLLCFDSMGQVVAHSSAVTGLSADCTSVSSKPVAYTVTAQNADRKLAVLVYVGGQVRMCDPARTLSSATPDGCPAL
jgi:type IV fimbrial biogenesis protein FimT